MKKLFSRLISLIGLLVLSLYQLPVSAAPMSQTLYHGNIPVGSMICLNASLLGTDQFTEELRVSPVFGSLQINILSPEKVYDFIMTGTGTLTFEGVVTHQILDGRPHYFPGLSGAGQINKDKDWYSANLIFLGKDQAKVRATLANASLLTQYGPFDITGPGGSKSITVECEEFKIPPTIKKNAKVVVKKRGRLKIYMRCSTIAPALCIPYHFEIEN